MMCYHVFFCELSSYSLSLDHLAQLGGPHKMPFHCSAMSESASCVVSVKFDIDSVLIIRVISGQCSI